MSKLETARQLAKQTLEQEKNLEMKFQKEVLNRFVKLKDNQVVVFNQVKKESSKSQELCRQISNQLLEQQGTIINQFQEQQGQILSLLKRQKSQEKWWVISLVILVVLLILVFLKMD